MVTARAARSHRARSAAVKRGRARAGACAPRSAGMRSGARSGARNEASRGVRTSPRPLAPRARSPVRPPRLRLGVRGERLDRAAQLVHDRRAEADGAEAIVELLVPADRRLTT